MNLKMRQSLGLAFYLLVYSIVILSDGTVLKLNVSVCFG